VYVKKKKRMKGNENERMKNRQWEEKEIFWNTGCRDAKKEESS
jgi:hypothetical protein